MSKDSLNHICCADCTGACDFYNILLESPYEGVIYVDENRIIRYVNDSYAKYNNLTPPELIGHYYNEFEIDENIINLQKTRKYEPYSYYFNYDKSFIASRRPVYKDGKFAGVLARYFSLNLRDINRKFGVEYLDLIAQMQIKEIMTSLDRAIMELNTYKDDFDSITNSENKGIDCIIGNSQAIKQLKNNILRVANSPSSVLITGESGTGKEIVAQAIHYHGNRSSKPFIKVNCAAIPDTLLESELFGYVDGAFTGARKGGKMGKFELANGGTIFLDEIGDMPMSMQAKLLRVLQEREFERLGSETFVKVDIRVISATNKDLPALIKEGQFREDLYYRLNIISLNTQPLRLRNDDIPLLVDYFIKQISNKLNRPVNDINNEALNMLIAYGWPGNVRELMNALESAINFSHSHILELDDFPLTLREKRNHKCTDDYEGCLQKRLDFEEKKLLITTLDECNGSRKEAAKILNVSKSTLYRMMKKHDLL